MVQEGGYLALVANRDFLLQSYKGGLSHQGFVVVALVRALFVFVEILHLRLARQKTQYKETMPLVLSNQSFGVISLKSAIIGFYVLKFHKND